MLSSRFSRTRASLVAASLCLAAATVSARDGDLDRRFGTNGIVERPFPGGYTTEEIFQDVRVLPDGKLLVSGTANVSVQASTDMAVMRLNADGSLDTTFGVGGVSLVGFDRPGSNDGDIARGLDVQADGRILLFGQAAGTTGGSDMAVARLLPDGTLDGSFGNGGKVTIAFDLGATPDSRNDQGVRGLALPDGRIVVGGLAYTGAGAVMALARLNANGTLDTSFDGDGKRILDFGGGPTDTSLAYAIIPANDGQRIYAVGSATIGGNQQIAIARLLANGTPDPSFAGDGTLAFAFDIGGNLAETATGGVELPDGRFLACGAAQVSATGNDIICAQFLANGTPDSGFPPVVVPLDVDNRGMDQAYAMRRDPLGRIVLAGFASVDETTFDVAVVRLMPNGQVDASFGDDGRQHYDGLTSGRTNRASSLALQPDGSIVLAGSVNTATPNEHHMQVMRLIGDTIHDHGFEYTQEE
ncbi:delta-60 repeat domain-containing protein [Dokdonella sp. MW10]|uniref:delta-60 repeat domain-containing protein n=1 Tax=Dokdonella sp. MW10 TaxID=2992926 RepID=UPI003F7D30FD